MPVKHTTAWRGRRPCRRVSRSRQSCRAVAAQQFQGEQSLRAVSEDVADVHVGGQMIRHSDANRLDARTPHTHFKEWRYAYHSSHAVNDAGGRAVTVIRRSTTDFWSWNIA